MTRQEALKDPERAAEILCDIVCEASWATQKKIPEIYFVCNMCPAHEWCRAGHIGFIDWLEKEDEK